MADKIQVGAFELTNLLLADLNRFQAGYTEAKPGDVEATNEARQMILLALSMVMGAFIGNVVTTSCLDEVIQSAMENVAAVARKTDENCQSEPGETRQ